MRPRLSSLRLSPTREKEIIEELSQHLDDVYHERRRDGAPHEQAMRDALDELDEQDLLARQMGPLRQSSIPPAPPPPGASGGNWLADMAHDAAFASRSMLHGGGWAAIVVLLLALGIGANTALFAAVDALMLSPLPLVEDPDSLVRFRWTGRNDAAVEHDEYGYTRPAADGQRVWASFSYPVFQQLARDGSGRVELFAAAPVSQVNLAIDGQAELADGFVATGNYFRLLGVSARLGRTFGIDDDRADAAPVATISWRFWRTRFGGDPAAVGRVIRANDVPVTIVGVLPPGFTGAQQTVADPPDVWFPLALDRQLRASTGRSDRSMLDDPNAWWLQVMGRLRPGAEGAGVQANLDGVFQSTARAGLDRFLAGLPEQERNLSENRNLRDIPRLLVDPARRGLYDVEDRTMTSAAILSAVVAVILLIICANVANLMLSRAVVRQKEIAVRLSLGATRSRLIRQLLTEALMLASLGAGLGLVVAYWGVRLLPPPASAVNVLHGRTFAFMAMAAVLTSLFFGAVPALRATRVDVNAGLKEVVRGGATRRGVLGRSLLVVQVALSLVVLVGAGLFLQTLAHLRRADVGFDPSNLLLVRVMPAVSGYDQARAQQLYGILLERFGAVSGVRGAALSQPALLSGSVSSTNIYVAGRPVPTDSRDRAGHEINRLVISPSFFDVMRIPLLRGRALTEDDDTSAPRVAVINETAARTFFAGDDPIGKRFGPAPDRTNVLEVVGIVHDAQYSNLREPVPPTIYVPYLQAPRAMVVFELRTSLAPSSVSAAVRETVRQVDPNLPLADMSTQVEQIERRFAQEKLFAQAYSLFGAVAVLLASIGLFGLMSYSVARRTSEMGVRMALGAQRGSVVRMVMRESLALVSVGVTAGLVLAIALGQFVAALLYGVPARDPWTLGTAIALMGAISAAASYLPARRASRVDPIVALRYE